MCGISGLIQLTTKKNNKELEQLFVNNLKHRGPDSSGFWEDKNHNGSIFLAHNRLSILDLSSNANQPMVSVDEELIICFNGEIYNFQSIKDEINKTIITNWKTDHSDTEVILKSFELWGNNCFEKFNGMFAIAIYNKKTKTLTLARDRFGIKPLYYTQNQNEFAFASELKPLLGIIDKKEISHEGIIDYLTNRGSNAPYSMVKNIFKLEKGCFLQVVIDFDAKLFEAQLKEYVNTDNYNITNGQNSVTNLLELEKKLKASIQSQWMSDVPVCLFLSGGIDSSLIAAISSELYPEKKVHAFCIGLGNHKDDETKYAQLVADKYNINLEVLNFDENPLDKIDEWLFFNDDLLSDPAAFAIYFLSQKIKEKGFKVVLSGEGSDELLGGYESYLAYHQKLSKPKLKILSFFFKLIFKFMPKRLYENLYEKNNKNATYWGAAQNYNLLSLNKLFNNKSVLNWFIEKNIKFEQKHATKSKLDYILHYDIAFRLPNDLLLRTDRATMASSIESRVPFLDNDFVKFAMELPLEYKFGINKNENKSILKELALKYFSHDFVYRKKQGFPMPVGNWFYEEKTVNQFNEYIGEQKISSLNYSYIKYMLDNHISKKQDFGDRLYSLFLLEKYVRFWNLN
jgi:asparagine synthase (glutamine-hydrolysing)